MKGLPSYREIIRIKLQAKIDRNSRYSLRAFAKDIGLSAPMLSQILSSKRNLSLKLAEQVAKKLKLDPKEHKLFVLLVKIENTVDSKSRDEALKQIEMLKTRSDLHLSPERFMRICDWVHFAILEIVRLEDFKPSTAWLSRRFKISEHRVKMAVDRLIELDYLRINAEGKWISNWHMINVKITSETEIRDNFILPVMDVNHQYLEHKGIGDARVSAHFVALDKSRLEEYKNRLRELEASFMAEFDTQDGFKNELYVVSCNLIPFK